MNHFSIFALVILSFALQGQRLVSQEGNRAIIIENVRIFDGESTELSQSTSVVVEAGLIKQISNKVERPEGCRIIEGKNRVLMPGLIDLHCHPMIIGKVDELFSEPREYLVFRAARVMEDSLMRGFTSIRDAGGTQYGFARAANEGLIRSPRIFHSGSIISQTGGHGDFRKRNDAQPSLTFNANSRNLNGMAVVVDGADEVRRAVRENLRQGATQVKIMASGGGASPYDHLGSVQFSDKEITAAVDAANDWGTYVFAHAYTDHAISRCLNNGVRCIEHANLVTPKLFDADATEPMLSKQTAKSVSDHEIFFVPTLVTYFALSGDADALSLDDNELKTINLLQESLGLREFEKQKLGLLAKATLRGLVTLRENNVKIGFGTDLIGGFVDPKTGEVTSFMDFQSKEFRVRLAAGFSDIDILRQATSISAKVLAMSGDKIGPIKGKPLGVVKLGAIADLLLVDGDPTEDVTILESPGNIAMIMQNGRIIKIDND